MCFESSITANIEREEGLRTALRCLGDWTFSRIASHISVFAALSALGRSRQSDARPLGARAACCG